MKVVLYIEMVLNFEFWAKGMMPQRDPSQRSEDRSQRGTCRSQPLRIGGYPRDDLRSVSENQTSRRWLPEFKDKWIFEF